MGNILGYLWGDTGRTDDPDPTTGLTSRDKYIITTTWKRLSSGKANMETGAAIFLNLFEKRPEYHQLFPFRDIPRDQLRNNSRFQAHCISVMYSLSSLVDNINTPEFLEALLIKQGVNHVPRNVPNEAYGELKSVLMDIFTKSMSQEELTTWDKFLELGFSIMVKATFSANKQ